MKTVEVAISAELPQGGRKTVLVRVTEQSTMEATNRVAVAKAIEMGYKDARPFLTDPFSRRVIEAVELQYGVTLDADSIVDAVQEIQRTGADRIVHHGEDEYTFFISADKTTIFVAKNVLTVSKDG